ncbi:hypothetical protein DEH69_26740 [Streptomyces sp. PT12]|nr:hypothetical protein DEH69_26740 [Streptomyces sp. PT12]
MGAGVALGVGQLDGGATGQDPVAVVAAADGLGPGQKAGGHAGPRARVVGRGHRRHVGDAGAPLRAGVCAGGPGRGRGGRGGRGRRRWGGGVRS